MQFILIHVATSTVHTSIRHIKVCWNFFVLTDHVLSDVLSYMYTCTYACHQLLCSNEDLCELGLGFGPRKKLSTFIKQHKENRELQRQKKVEARERAQREEEERKKAELSDEATDGRSSSKLFGAKIVYGLAGTGQACVKYPTLLFSPQNLFALGSPIGLFLTVRCVARLGLRLGWVDVFWNAVCVCVGVGLFLPYSGL